jgi:hypothetical protein
MVVTVWTAQLIHHVKLLPNPIIIPAWGFCGDREGIILRQRASGRIDHRTTHAVLRVLITERKLVKPDQRALPTVTS